MVERVDAEEISSASSRYVVASSLVAFDGVTNFSDAVPWSTHLLRWTRTK